MHCFHYWSHWGYVYGSVLPAADEILESDPCDDYREKLRPGSVAAVGKGKEIVDSPSVSPVDVSEGVQAFPWAVETKYYTATIYLHTTSASVVDYDDSAENIHGLIVLFNPNQMKFQGQAEQETVTQGYPQGTVEKVAIQFWKAFGGEEDEICGLSSEDEAEK
ncbi:hypothetical protein HPB50_015623 [Hyalomma asiaticum]|uniref:Uncharacterized protein n=1 Tax=Hyalomma asiaticum TaxID=266040 RepID=A0ACB7SWN4_HYAAI|nr:hypothetical protein HPB50_015623 [Hyalomma asiaticum]